MNMMLPLTDGQSLFIPNFKLHSAVSIDNDTCRVLFYVDANQGHLIIKEIRDVTINRSFHKFTEDYVWLEGRG